MSYLSQLKRLVGRAPKESGFKKKMRIHQGWWRAFVLNEPEGPRPQKESDTVCNTIVNGNKSGKNFLSEGIRLVVKETLDLRDGSKAAGIMDRNRLYGNLLSSQPLCFNFFAESCSDKGLAKNVLNHFFSQVTEVTDVRFEYAPEENFLSDNSAFDVVFFVKDGSKKGLIGLERKYTDSFASTPEDKDSYRDLFDNSSQFLSKFEDFFNSKYNQLFRNQLIAEASMQNKKFDFVMTGRFCHQNDQSAINIGNTFQRMLKDGEKAFQVITYQDYIEAMQRLDLDWDKRELSMLFWARYCGTKLSEGVYEQFQRED